MLTGSLQTQLHQSEATMLGRGANEEHKRPYENREVGHEDVHLQTKGEASGDTSVFVS